MSFIGKQLRQVFKKGSGSAIKILLLSVGLAMGIVLVARIYFEKTYEGFVQHGDRTFRIMSSYTTSDKHEEWGQTAGAIAPGIRAYSPYVEVATRYTRLDDDIKVVVLDKSGAEKGRVKGRDAILADSSFFRIFERKIYSGIPQQLLHIPGMVMVSKSFAAKLSTNGSAAVGTSFYRDNMDKVLLTVGGVYDDFPANSELNRVDVVISLSTIGKFMFDGTENWMGNDRYFSFVRLRSAQDMGQVRSAVVRMCNERLPQEELRKAGVSIGFNLKPIQEFHSQNEEVKRLCSILLILLLVILVSATLNYILISISEMVRKAKQVAVHRCYGASSRRIYSMLLSEAFINIFISLVISVLLILLFRSTIEDLLSTSIGSLLSVGSTGLILLICLGIFLVCGIIPGSIYSRIPLAAAFRRYRESSRLWKLLLLFMQFIGSSFFITLLLVVFLQYNLMITSDPGYSYKNLGYMELGKVDNSSKEYLVQQLGKLPFVEGVSLASQLPFNGASGNNIMLPNDDKELFNAADLYYVSHGYLKMMQIPVVEGRSFDEVGGSPKVVMVSQSFASKLSQIVGWKDGVIGKSIIVTEHSTSPSDGYTICGVYKDYVIGTLQSADTRPSVQFCAFDDTSSLKRMEFVLLKMRELTPGNVAAINRIIEEVYPQKELSFTSYADELSSLYAESRRFRKAVLLSGIIVILITMIGLIGYSRDEINRRKSEIAIRKINGAQVSSILDLFIKSILQLAMPAVAVGLSAAYYVSVLWLGLFSVKLTLSWWIFASSAAITLFAILLVVLFTTIKAANRNPIDNLRSE